MNDNDSQTIVSSNYVDIFKGGRKSFSSPIATATTLELKVEKTNKRQYCQAYLHFSDREFARVLNYLGDNWCKKLYLEFWIENRHCFLKGIIESVPLIEITEDDDDDKNLVIILVDSFSA